MHWLITLAVIALVPVTFIALAWARARRFLAASHLEEIHNAFVPFLRRAVLAADEHSDVESEDMSFKSSAGLLLLVTGSHGDDGPIVHLSYSTPGRHMPRALAIQLGTFLIATVSQNRLEVDPFFTSSGVHHIIITGELDTLQVLNFDDTAAFYNAAKVRIPFQFRSLEQDAWPQEGAS